MAGKKDTEDLKAEIIFDYGDKLGNIEKVNISETFDDPVMLAAACFHPNTLVKMKDGSSKKIREILIGDEVYMGGRVYMKMESLTDDMYNIDGVLVGGTHTVYENGQWVQVQDAKSVEAVEGVYTIINLGTDEHMIITDSGVIFSDYYVTNEHVEIDKQLVNLINEEKNKKFMQEVFKRAN